MLALTHTPYFHSILSFIPFGFVSFLFLLCKVQMAGMMMSNFFMFRFFTCREMEIFTSNVLLLIKFYTSDLYKQHYSFK